MKKILAMLLCCVILVSFVACGVKPATDPTATPAQGSVTPSPANTNPVNTGTQTAAPTLPTKDTVIIGVDSDTGSLDPHVMSGTFMVVLGCYAEALWEYDGTGDGFASRYLLAESVDTISDTEYVIHLREGVTFSNGNPFNAEDVIFTLNYIANESTRPYYIASVDVAKTVAEDDYTVRLFMKYYDKTQMPSLTSIYMLDAESYDPATSGQNPIGTGPYVVTKYVVNSSVELVARDDYWGGTPAIKNVIFKNIAESSQKVNAIETGEVDMLSSCPTSDVDYVEGLDGVRVIEKASVSQVMLTFNGSAASPLATKEARWAVAYAVNSLGIINVALNGHGTAARAPFSSGASDFSEDVADLHDTYATGYNLELAKQYAEESGLVGQTVRLVTNGTDVYATAAQIIEQALKEIGVNAQVVNLDQATVRNLIAGEADWEVYVSWTSNPSGLGLDMIYAQISKFNRSHFDYDTELFNTFNEKGLELLATSDPAAYKTLLLDYLTMFEDSCFVYGIADMSTISAAVDPLLGIRTDGFALEKVGDWYYVS